MAFGEIEPTGTIFSAWHMGKTHQSKYKTLLTLRTSTMVSFAFFAMALLKLFAVYLQRASSNT